MFRRPLALLAVVLLAAACTSGGPAATGATTTSTAVRSAPTTTLPTVLTSATPAGWVPVAYGDVQVSVPPDWYVRYDVCTTAASPGVVYVGQPSPGVECTAAVTSGNVVLLLPLTPGQPLLNALTVINGISTVSAVGTDGWGDYALPSLGVLLAVHGSGGFAVARTLTWSPADVATAAGPAPSVPQSWRRVTGGDVRVAVPGSWPVRAASSEGPTCTWPGSLAQPESVVLDTDSSSAAPGCGEAPSTRPPVPSDGVVVDLHPLPGWPPSTTLGPCLHLHGVTACPYARAPTTTNDRMAELDILFVQLTVPGHVGHELLEIGLAGNGMTARTILDSLLPA